MGTAFMFYLMGFDKFEGWVGVDQFDPRNPLVHGFHDRFVARYGQEPPLWPNAIPVLAYDTARVLVEGLFRAPILSGPGLKAGLETIRFMPSTTGGARTHIACSPYEHGMFRGDWLLYGTRAAMASSSSRALRAVSARPDLRARGQVARRGLASRSRCCGRWPRRTTGSSRLNRLASRTARISRSAPKASSSSRSTTLQPVLVDCGEPEALARSG